VGTAQGGITVPQVGCNLTAIYDATTLGSTPMISAATGQTIYLCGYSMFANGANNVELDGGTGATCGTSTVKLTPAYQFQTQSGMSDQSSIFRGLKTAVGSGLCVKTTTASPVQVIVYYAQF
jgi:hypothetical protein